MTNRRADLLVCLAVAVTLSGIAGAVALGMGVVTASHGAPDADYTVEPMSDRNPGTSDGSTVRSSSGRPASTTGPSSP